MRSPTRAEHAYRLGDQMFLALGDRAGFHVVIQTVVFHEFLHGHGGSLIPTRVPLGADQRRRDPVVTVDESEIFQPRANGLVAVVAVHEPNVVEVPVVGLGHRTIPIGPRSVPNRDLSHRRREGRRVELHPDGHDRARLVPTYSVDEGSFSHPRIPDHQELLNHSSLFFSCGFFLIVFFRTFFLLSPADRPRSMATQADSTVVKVDFGLLGAEEVVRSSVVEVKSTVLYDHTIPSDEGVNSLKLGTSDSHIRCSTCRHSVRSCPGHTGVLHLATPCYHMHFIDNVVKVLRSVCYWCSKLLTEPISSSRRRKQLATLASVGRSTSTCPSCKGPQPSYTRLGIGIERTWEANAEFEDEDERDLANSPFDATKVHTILRHITDDDIAHLGLSPDHSRPESMLLTHLLIPSTVIRPSVTVDDGSRTRGQDDLTHKLNDVLKTNALVREAILAKDEEATARHIEALQLHLCLYFDKDASTAVQQAQRRPTPRTGQCRSLASRMRGKRGRVRGNMMGKRVDFSSRSVITGTPAWTSTRWGCP